MSVSDLPRRLLAAVVVIGLSGVLAHPSSAQVTVTRSGSENPMKEIATSTIYGGLAGLVLGGATALAVEENEDSIVKWFFVGGTFFGFGYGIYHVSSRPEPQALVGVGSDGRARLSVPLPGVTLGRRGDATVSVTLLSFSF